MRPPRAISATSSVLPLQYFDACYWCIDQAGAPTHRTQWWSTRNFAARPGPCNAADTLTDVFFLFLVYLQLVDHGDGSDGPSQLRKAPGRSARHGGRGRPTHQDCCSTGIRCTEFLCQDSLEEEADLCRRVAHRTFLHDPTLLSELGSSGPSP